MKKANKGFTMVELLVVVVITLFLGAIAMPMYFSYNEKADKKAVSSDLKGLQSAMETYYAENQDVPSSAAGAITDWAAKYSDKYTYTRGGAHDYQFKSTGKIGGVYIYIDEYGIITETAS